VTVKTFIYVNVMDGRFRGGFLKTYKRRSAERLDLRNFKFPPKQKQVHDGLLKGFLVGLRPGTDEYREAHRKAVMIWRLAGRDKRNPNYGKRKWKGKRKAKTGEKA